MISLLKQYYLQGAKTASLGLGLDANAFVQFAHEDTTEDASNGVRPTAAPDEKAVHWSGRTNLESGDTGTRNEQLGVPRGGAV
jgi:hypothetical protein